MGQYFLYYYFILGEGVGFIGINDVNGIEGFYCW